MKPTAILTGILLLLSGISVPAAAQSVKDIIGDKTGAYIYAQAYDETEEEALELATDELKSRVATYLGSNKKTSYNKSWQESIKRIINQKYGRARVFLYLSVSDLDPKAATSNKAVKTKAEAARKVESVKKEESAKKETTAKTEAPVKKEAPVSQSPQKPQSVQPTQTPQSSRTASVTLLDGPVADLIKRLMAGNADIPGLLGKAKNMRMVSMYGNAPSKYETHAYLVVKENGSVHVYSPVDKSTGNRTDFADGKTVKAPAGQMIYWFLKK